MIIPKPLPEEFSYGYLGRIYHINDMAFRSYTTWDRLFHCAQLGVSDISWQQRCLAGKTALLAGMETKEYLQNYSLAPFIFAFDRHIRKDEHAVRPRYQRDIGLRPIRTEAYLCKTCFDEQARFRGYYCWNRQHQIPGITYCFAHMEPLLSTEITHCVLEQPDRNVLNNTITHPLARTACPKSVHLYQQVALSVLKQPHSAFLSELSGALCRKPPRLDLELPIAATLATIKDMLYSFFPTAWLEWHAAEFKILRQMNNPSEEVLWREYLEDLDTQSLLLLLCAKFTRAHRIVEDLYRNSHIRLNCST